LEDFQLFFPSSFSFSSFPWTRTILDNVIVHHIVKKFPAFTGARKFIRVQPTARHFIPVQTVEPHVLTIHVLFSYLPRFASPFHSSFPTQLKPLNVRDWRVNLILSSVLDSRVWKIKFTIACNPFIGQAYPPTTTSPCAQPSSIATCIFRCCGSMLPRYCNTPGHVLKNKLIYILFIEHHKQLL
jgi:hypothetical protein